MQYLSDKRNLDAWWGSYQCPDGDLISMSYLDLIGSFFLPEDRTRISPPSYKGKKNIALYLQGDSYSWHINDTDFCGLAVYKHIPRRTKLKYQLDSTQTNILLLEIAEREVRNYLSTTAIFDEIIDSPQTEKPSALIINQQQKIQKAGFPQELSVNQLFNPYINQNLQFNLFNYQFIMPVFQAKAALNYYAFSRASGDVVISDDKNYLFLKETVSFTDAGSSYINISDADIDYLTNNLNRIYDHYKKTGFTEVYLAIIPNSATIVQPKGYNNFIPRLQQAPNLKMKVIDSYSFFKNTNHEYCYHGDSHWNYWAKQNWLALVNNELVKYLPDNN
jgi:hypothetical protein